MDNINSEEQLQEQPVSPAGDQPAGGSAPAPFSQEPPPPAYEPQTPVSSENEPTADPEPQPQQSNLDAARAAGNTWTFGTREMEMFVARGEASVQTAILDRITRQPTNAVLVHNFKWEKRDPFIHRENHFKTSLQRIGRSTDQKVDTAHLASANGEFYAAVVAGGQIVIPQDVGDPQIVEKSKDDMMQFAKSYPESASEAVTHWLEGINVELLGGASDAPQASFEWMFTADDVVEVVWKLGDKDYPDAAAILVFSVPSPEARKNYEKAVQDITSKRSGDVSTAELQEKFVKKIQYGAKHLTDVKGIAVGSEGTPFDKTKVEEFIDLWNPAWFAECVEVMNESFQFLTARSESN